MMKVISVRENPEYKEIAMKYFPSKWPEVAPEIYEDCIAHAVGDKGDFTTMVSAGERGRYSWDVPGLNTNDFISQEWSLVSLGVCLVYRGRIPGKCLCRVIIGEGKGRYP